MLSFIEELRKKNNNPKVMVIPIKEITNRFPLLGDIWKQYKGMCNYGTHSKEQTELINSFINEFPHLVQMRNEVMSYPNKDNYYQYEKNDLFNNQIHSKKMCKFNDVWNIANGKYQHLIKNLSFPKYYWRENELNELKEIGADPRGNFYYPKGSFREWHTNVIHRPGYRIYFISCKEDGKSWFNYVDKETDKVVNLPDKNEYVNIFYVNDTLEEATWHSIYSETDRFSLGFNIT
jgi:hypothetical protein